MGDDNEEEDKDDGDDEEDDEFDELDESTSTRGWFGLVPFVKVVWLWTNDCLDGVEIFELSVESVIGVDLLLLLLLESENPS